MSALLSLWLRLTGGESGCPRRRFVLTLLVSCGLYHLLLPTFMECAVAVEKHGLPPEFSPLFTPLAVVAVVVVLVSLLLVFLPLSPLVLPGAENTLAELWQLMQGAHLPNTPAPNELWLYQVGFLCGAPLLLLVGGTAFATAWRRLRDAGSSPLFLLLGLTCLLGFDKSGSFSAESAGLYLLGPLWLIILYSQPSVKERHFDIFRPTPSSSRARRGKRQARL